MTDEPSRSRPARASSAGRGLGAFTAGLAGLVVAARASRRSCSARTRRQADQLFIFVILARCGTRSPATAASSRSASRRSSGSARTRSSTSGAARRSTRTSRCARGAVRRARLAPARSLVLRLRGGAVRDRHVGRRRGVRDPVVARPRRSAAAPARRVLALQPPLHAGQRLRLHVLAGARRRGRRCSSILFLLLRSRLGASLQAIRDDEEAARVARRSRAARRRRALRARRRRLRRRRARSSSRGTLSIPPLEPDSIFGFNGRRT